MSINILVIDDHALIVRDFNSIFHGKCFNVYYADGIDNGLEIADRYIPDIIISSLTSLSLGKKLINNISGRSGIRFLPLIYISYTKWEKSEFREIMNLGVSDYFADDFEPIDLVNSVKLRTSNNINLKNHLMEVCQRAFEVENLNRKDHVLITVGGKLHLIKYEDIICITAEKEYSKIRTQKGKSIIVRKSLKTWLEFLPTNIFLRIHRQSIINVNAIEKIEKLKSRSYVVYLKSLHKPLELSRRYSSIMRKTFSGYSI